MLVGWSSVENFEYQSRLTSVELYEAVRSAVSVFITVGSSSRGNNYHWCDCDTKPSEVMQ